MDLHFATAWEAVADACADMDAIAQGERHMTYRDYDEQSAMFAGALAGHGLGPGSKVSLYLYNSPEYLVAQHGALKARAGERELPLPWR